MSGEPIFRHWSSSLPESLLKQVDRRPGWLGDPVGTCITSAFLPAAMTKLRG
jgi:hypothetical protein